MSEVAIIILSDLATLVISLLSVTFLAGQRWQDVKRDIADIKTNVAKIEGMFVLRIRPDLIDKER